MDFVHISPLQRMVMHRRAKATSRIKKNKPITIKYNEMFNTKLTKDEKNIINLLEIELEDQKLDFLFKLLSGKI